MENNQEHTRVIESFLRGAERKALDYFCARAPAWANPDTMTTIGIIGSIMIATGYILTYVHPAFLWLATLGFVVNWYGDSMDGTLARYRKIERPKYGYYVDHAVDIVSEFIVIIALGISPLVRFEIAALALIGYLMMSGHVFLRTYVDQVFQISYGRLGPTEVRVIFMTINTIVFFVGNPSFDVFSSVSLTLFDFVIAGIAALLFFFFFTSMVKTSRFLAKAGE